MQEGLGSREVSGRVREGLQGFRGSQNVMTLRRVSNGIEENVLRYRASRGRYRLPSCGRRANDLGWLAPSRWRGLGAAINCRGVA